VNDELRRLLTPPDDGRAFVEAVLLRASGALYRRRQGGAAVAPAWELLAAWARPWVLALLLLVAVITVAPLRRQAPAELAVTEDEVRAEALLTASQPEDVFALTRGR
jgi:hypothetical protein